MGKVHEGGMGLAVRPVRSCAVDAYLHDAGAEEDISVVRARSHVVGVGRGGSGASGGAVGVARRARVRGGCEEQREEGEEHSRLPELGVVPRAGSKICWPFLGCRGATECLFALWRRL